MKNASHESTPALRQHTTTTWAERREAEVLHRCADLRGRFDDDLILAHKGRLRFVTDAHHGIKPGRYALPVVVRREGGNDLAFYEIAELDDPRLAGFVLAYRLQASHQVVVPRRQVPRLFERIVAFGPDAAAALFRTVGTCRRCGARLTSLRSRVRGVGARCAEHPEAEAAADRPHLVPIPGGSAR